MSNLYLGTQRPKKIYIGTDSVRSVYLGTQKVWSILPNAYQEVEYLESTGTQYIDTNFIPNQDTKLILDCKVTRNDMSGRMAGIYSAPYTNAFLISITWSLNYGAYAQFDNVTESSSTGFYPILNTKYRYELSKDGFYINGELKTSYTGYTNFSCPQSLLVMAMYNVGSHSMFASNGLKLYVCKIYDNNSLVRNFIPCYRKSDNEAGLYDTVNGVFYTNAGTGTFNVGNNV